jgi:outer membrane immunogenic protein
MRNSKLIVSAAGNGPNRHFQEPRLPFRFRIISLYASACLMAGMLMFSGGPAAAGFGLPAFGTNAANASSWVAGGHAGYNWQQGSMVYGFETDFQGTGLNSSMTGGLTPSSIPSTDYAHTTASINDYGTFRGRFGFTTGQWLFYGTGGAAYGNVNLSSQFSTLGLLMTALDVTQPKFGWVVGAGFEYLLRPNWMFTLNYQYVDLGNVSLASSATFGPITIGQVANVHAQFQTVMIGFSYRFAPDGSPSPWAGGYAGGQAGGAWGDRANAMYNSSLGLF